MLRYRSSVLLTFCLLGIAGCGDIINEIDDLKRAVDATANKGISESKEWRSEVEGWRTGRGKLAEAAANFMKNAIPDAEGAANRVVGEAKKEMAELAQDVAAESKLTVDYANARIKADVLGVGKALETLRTESKQGKKPLVDRFISLIENLAKEQDVEPKTGIAVPRDAKILWDTPDKQHGFTVNDKSISISGFGFQQRTVKEFLKAKIDKGDPKEGKDLSATSLVINSDFLTTIDLMNDDLKKLPDASVLRLFWNEKELHSVNLRWYRQPLAGPDNGVKLTLSYDSKKIKKIDPLQWNFGLAPSSATLIRADNKPATFPAGAEINLNGIGILPDDLAIELKWDAEDIQSGHRMMRVPFKRDIELPHVEAVVVTVRTTRNDKDREIAFKFTVHQQNVGPIGSVEVGRNEIWPDNPQDIRGIRVPVESERMFKSNRLRYTIRMEYNSSNGDPNWIGRISATAKMADGESIPLLGETGDFEMGHHDNGQRRERILRDFDFNQ